MMNSDIEQQYFNWMESLIRTRKKSPNSYKKLLHHLYEREFTYIIPRDENREADGINLRYRFGYEAGYEDVVITNEIDIRACSVLEMMIALALRCEESMMSNPEYGDRLGHWFWGMVDNLGLGEMSNSVFDEHYADIALDRFINREYSPDGKGGLFTVKHPPKDMRNVEIWYQANWYFDEVEGV